MSIGPNTTVYLWVHHPINSSQRAWLSSYETVRNKFGELVICPKLDDDPRGALTVSYQTGLILKRRIESENVISSLYTVHFSLQPSGDEVGAGHTTSAPTDDNRTVMIYRGLLARPGISVNHGRCYFVKFPGTTIESMRGSTVEEVVDAVYERGLQDKAEQAPPQLPASPEQSAQQNKFGSGVRVRPGSLYDVPQERR